MLRASRLLRSGRTHGTSARERAGVGGTGPPRGGHCPCGNSPGQGSDRWGVGEESRRPSPRHAVGRCAQEVRRHGPVAGRRGGVTRPWAESRSPGKGRPVRERADLDAKNRGVRRLRSWSRGIACRGGVPGGPGAGRLVAALRTQRRQAGHGHSGALGGLPDRTGFTCVRLSVAVVMAFRSPCRLQQRGNRNALMFGSWLEMPARCHDALLGGEMAHRRVRADGMRIQQAEEEQTQPQHTHQSRC